MTISFSTTVIKATCDDVSGCERAVSDPTRRISSHLTLEGHLVYYRCYCNKVQVLLVSPVAATSRTVGALA